jgi:hypothetical protein
MPVLLSFPLFLYINSSSFNPFPNSTCFTTIQHDFSAQFQLVTTMIYLLFDHRFIFKFKTLSYNIINSIVLQEPKFFLFQPFIVELHRPIP